MEDGLAVARKRLLDLRAELLADDARASADRAPVTLDQDSVGRLSRVDAMQMQAMALAAQQRRKVELDKVDAALRRVESCDYAVCGEAIAQERLELVPTATRCIICIPPK